MPVDTCWSKHSRWACCGLNATHANLLRSLPWSYSGDDGSEFNSKALGKWAYENKVALDFSRSIKLTDGPFVEPINGSLRDECWNSYGFLSLDDAREQIETWREEYGTSHLHSIAERFNDVRMSKSAPWSRKSQLLGTIVFLGEGALKGLENSNYTCN